MEKKLNISDKLDFNDIDLTAPEKVISEVLDQIITGNQWHHLW